MHLDAFVNEFWRCINAVMHEKKEHAAKCIHKMQGILSMYEGVIVPTALSGAGGCGMRSAGRRKVNILEMKCLRGLVEVSRRVELGM